MKMGIYGISLKVFVWLMMGIGIVLGMTIQFHWPDMGSIFILSIGGFLKGTVGLLFGFTS